MEQIDLLGLPWGILGRLWPEERIIMGKRVCRELHNALVNHASSLLLAKRPGLTPASIVEDLSCAATTKVKLKWDVENDNDSQVLMSGIEETLANGLGLGLCSLEIQDSVLGAASRHSSQFVQLVARCTALTTIKLGGFRVLDELNENDLAHAFEQCPGLTGVALYSNGILESNVDKVCRALCRCPQITHLDLGCNNLREEGVRGLAAGLRACTELSYLDLGGCGLGDDGTATLVDALGQHHNISTLTLHWNSISRRGMATLGGFLAQDCCRNLTALDVSHQGFGPGGPEHLAGCSRLRTLNLGGNYVCDAGAPALALVLQHNAATLHELRLHSNQLKLVSELLQGLTNLRALGLNDNLINDAELAALARPLAQCSALAMLNLAANRFEEAGARHLAALLPRCPQLAAVFLSLNTVRGSGATAVLRAAKGCSALTELDLSRVSLEEDCAALGEALGECRFLRRLQLAGNALRDAGARLLAEALGRGEGLRLEAVDLSRAEIGGEGFEALAAALRKTRMRASVLLDENLIPKEKRAGVDAGLAELDFGEQICDLEDW